MYAIQYPGIPATNRTIAAIKFNGIMSICFLKYQQYKYSTLYSIATKEIDSNTTITKIVRININGYDI